MRKKSHIALTHYLIKHMPDSRVQNHKFSFYLGSILPDIKPSFVYKKHEYYGTLDEFKQRVEELINLRIAKKREERKYCRDLGQISHYLADYFTFPHNKNYDGTMTEHIHYENFLKKDIRKHLKEIAAIPRSRRKMGSHEEVLDYIRKHHDRYLEKKSNVANDIRNIVEVNHQAIAAIDSLHNKARNKHKNMA